MAKEYPAIPEKLARFAMEQKIFFIATCAGDDDVNVSPKGVAPLKVVDEKTVVYADYHGSGDKTAEHLGAGGKATIMFTSFDEEPMVLRFFCRGRVVAKASAEFGQLCQRLYPELDMARMRQLFYFEVYRVQRSCGYGTPLMEYVGDRSGKAYYRELWGE
ncbi:MAG: pyridoxamine 5'-phosphate oxidase family protein [Nitrospinota bacterium]|nr:pyridoxamine 5'-phosphate oxidase family protein [Nitrospinota bacterium]